MDPMYQQPGPPLSPNRFSTPNQRVSPATHRVHPRTPPTPHPHPRHAPGRRPVWPARPMQAFNSDLWHVMRARRAAQLKHMGTPPKVGHGRGAVRVRHLRPSWHPNCGKTYMLLKTERPRGLPMRPFLTPLYYKVAIYSLVFVFVL